MTEDVEIIINTLRGARAQLMRADSDQIDSPNELIEVYLTRAACGMLVELIDQTQEQLNADRDQTGQSS